MIVVEKERRSARETGGFGSTSGAWILARVARVSQGAVRKAASRAVIIASEFITELAVETGNALSLSEAAR